MVQLIRLIIHRISDIFGNTSGSGDASGGFMVLENLDILLTIK